MDNTKKKLIEAAITLFAQKGFDHVTTREICEAAHVNGALVNYHFGSKEKLYQACLREIFNHAGLELTEIDRAVHDANTWKKAMRAWVTTLSETLHATNGLMGSTAGLLRQEIHNSSEMSRFVLKSYGKPIFESLCRLLRMALKQEEEVRLWATSIWSQISASALVDSLWRAPFSPTNEPPTKWHAKVTHFLCERIFKELRYVRTHK